MSKPDYERDRAWEGTYVSQVRSILLTLLPYCVEISTASVELDNTCATDFTLVLTGGAIAVRLRRPGCKFRELTIRAQRDNGAKTELAKIKEGHAFRYFYAWIDENGKLAEWILVDLDSVRSSGLLEKERRLIANKNQSGKPDGTHFIGIPIRELYDADCLLAYNLINKPVRNVNVNASFKEGVEQARYRQYFKPFKR